MNLFTQNNLLDVDDILESRRGLQLRDCAAQDAREVRFDGGKVVTDRFYLSAFDPRENVYLRGDSNGRLYVDATSNIRYWVRTRTEDIALTHFHNDVGGVYRAEMAPVSFSANYLDLINRPTLQDLMREEFGYDPLCKEGSNLADLSEMISDSPYLDLGLNRYATCNYTPSMLFDRVGVTNLNLAYTAGLTGLVTRGASVVDLNEAIGETATLDSVGLTRLQSDVPTAAHARMIYSNVVQRAEDKIQFYEDNVREVDDYLKANLTQYVLASSNLSEVHMDETLDNLGLRKLKESVDLSDDSIDVGNMNMLFIPNKYNLYVDALKDAVGTKYPHLKNRGFKYAFMYKNDSDETDFQDPDGFPVATRSTIGIVRAKRTLNNVFEEGASPKMTHMHLHNVSHLEKMRSALNAIDLYKVLDAIYEESLIENTRLLRFSCNLAEMKDISDDSRRECYSNLGLASVVYTNDYEDLQRKPTSVDCFENDVGFASRWNNLNEYVANAAASRDNLGLGSLSVRDIRDFDLEGSTVEMDFARVYSKLTLNHLPFDLLTNLRLVQEDLMYMGREPGEDRSQWRGLPEGNEHGVEGVVRLHDTLQYDEHGGYTPSVLRALYEELRADIRAARNAVAEAVSDL